MHDHDPHDHDPHDHDPHDHDPHDHDPHDHDQHDHDPHDHDTVAELLGRIPQSEFEVVVRDPSGEPVVLRNAPFLRDGTPMPTRFWLAGRAATRQVSHLEADGGVRRAEAELDPAEVAAVHARYAAERDAAIATDHVGPRPSGGVAGTRQGVKCLHAHYAYHLAGGDDPVGRWVAARLLEAGSP